MRVLRNQWLWVTTSLLLAIGCDDRVHPPAIDPAAAGEAAISQYDKNNDAKISDAELDAVPGLKRAMGLYDADGDGGISADEVSSRILEWQEKKIGLAPAYACTVLLKGKPLAGATVTFEPEEYLGGTLVQAIATTDVSGVAFVEIPQADLPSGQDGLHGTQVGVYKVRITHPAKEIAARYNTETVFGLEISNETIMAQTDENNVVFKLR